MKWYFIPGWTNLIPFLLEHISCHKMLIDLDEVTILRTFARKFSNIDFFLKIFPLKDDELVMSEMQKKLAGHRLCFGENMPGRTPKSE